MIYFNATHETFISMIGGHQYTYPVILSYQYANICESAIKCNLEVVKMFDDGVVYKIINQ